MLRQNNPASPQGFTLQRAIPTTSPYRAIAAKNHLRRLQRYSTLHVAGWLGQREAVVVQTEISNPRRELPSCPPTAS